MGWVRGSRSRSDFLRLLVLYMNLNTYEVLLPRLSYYVFCLRTMEFTGSIVYVINLFNSFYHFTFPCIIYSSQ